MSPVRVTALYVAVTLVFTWPLALGLMRDIPWDLGDSLLNAWILAWDADHLRRFLSGDPGALRGFWNANIFHPEPLTLAYSEHLFAQAVQILPIYALTGNIILAYNLLFLATFVLSGLGAFLLVREITGSPRAAFAAGLIYAFAPYRVPQFAHLQVLSSQWMPFVLYGMRRYFDTIAPLTAAERPMGFAAPPRRPALALAGAAFALILQNLSNGYFLFFFAPFVLMYAVFEIAARNLWREARVWVSLGAAAIAVAIVTVPFLLPYLELRRNGQPVRPLNEVIAYSADVYSYLTAPPESHVWGGAMRAMPKPEGDLFPPLTAVILASIAIVASLREAVQAIREAQPGTSVRRVLVYALAAIGTVYAALAVMLLAGIRMSAGSNFVPVSVSGIGRPILILTLSSALILALSPAARHAARRWTRGPMGFTCLALAATFALSLGPEIRSAGRLIAEIGPYSLLYSYVPGFDGLRVPARFAMLFLLFLAMAAGIGAAAIERRFSRGGAVAIVLGLVAVAEAFAAPIIINGSKAEAGYAAPAPRVHTGADTPEVYRYIGSLPRNSVLVEFPFGEWAYELRYVFYSTAHWRPLLNGYSGAFPLSYSIRASMLRHPLDNPDLAWDELMQSGATHAVVHEGLYLDDEGRRIAAWLESRGARQASEFDGDRVFSLR